MKYGKLIFWLVFIILINAPTCPASQNARAFLAALEAYKAGDYAAAISGWQAIAQTGVQNGKLFYNLGNAYLKAKQLGPAILWYEKALHLLPNDPDLRFNYDYARSLTKDVPEESASPLVRILFFWNYQLSSRTIKILAIGFNLLFWLLATVWHLTRRRAFRRAALLVLVPTMIFVLTTGFNYYAAANRRQAVVLPDSVAVRSGLEPRSTELFALHAGAKVDVLKTLKDHYQIRFSPEKIGWVAAKNLGLI